MFAVLQDAVECICIGNSRDPRLFKDALEWVLSKSREQPFAFECICDALDLDPTCLRRGLSLAAGSHGKRPECAVEPSSPWQRSEEHSAHAR